VILPLLGSGLSPMKTALTTTACARLLNLEIDETDDVIPTLYFRMLLGHDMINFVMFQ
jgi:hypothetical protein